MYCQKCGVELADTVRFCPKCGGAVAEPQGRAVTGQNSISDRWESRVETVPPSAESEVIELYETFGWELLSTQTIDSSNSHLENHFGVIYSVTESKNYVKLSFRRNKNMPDYAQYTALEEQYIAASSITEPADPGKVFMIGAIIAFLSMPFTSIIGIAAGIFCIIKYRQTRSSYEEAYQAYIKAREEANSQKYNAIQAARNL